VAKGKTAETRRAEAHLYLGKATQFVEEAALAVEAGRYDAALLNAIHAGISSADAVTVALLGLRSTDPDHQRAADLLEEAAGGGPTIRKRSRQLRALLGRKNVVEYESRPATVREARDGVARASRLVDWARDVIDKARVKP